MATLGPDVRHDIRRAPNLPVEEVSLATKVALSHCCPAATDCVDAILDHRRTPPSARRLTEGRAVSGRPSQVAVRAARAQALRA